MSYRVSRLDTYVRIPPLFPLLYRVISENTLRQGTKHNSAMALTSFDAK